MDDNNITVYDNRLEFIFSLLLPITMVTVMFNLYQCKIMLIEVTQCINNIRNKFRIIKIFIMRDKENNIQKQKTTRCEKKTSIKII